ncbi:hypothetical protein HU200_056627 [Digitaria exilis]|uniref:Importin alpha n=1 Tax=Digitaria exilis TaxID=1010633 RepID=A0A835AIC3_9POAL|nr:hypothetical protein HU200_056627 [Digitaria exilis]
MQGENKPEIFKIWAALDRKPKPNVSTANAPEPARPNPPRSLFRPFRAQTARSSSLSFGRASALPQSGRAPAQRLLTLGFRREAMSLRPSERAELRRSSFSDSWQCVHATESPLIEEVVSSGLVPGFIQLLAKEHCPELQAVWALGNMASNTAICCNVVRAHGALFPVKLAHPVLRQLIHSQDDEVLTTLPPVLIPKLHVIANIVSKDDVQIQSVINRNMVGPLVHLMQTAEFGVRYEAA